jgi:hypothetical protein
MQAQGTGGGECSTEERQEELKKKRMKRGRIEREEREKAKTSVLPPFS